MDQQHKPSPIKQALTSTLTNQWPASRNISAAPIVAAMLGLSAPIMVGAATGHLQSGVAASLGGLIIGSQHSEGSLKDRILALTYALAAGSAAMFIGAALSGKDIAGWAIVAMSSIVAFFGGMTRPLARATTQFFIMLIIAGNMNLHGMHPTAMTILFALGAIWATVLSLGLEPLFQSIRPSSAPVPSPPSTPAARYTFGQLFRYWRHNLRHWAGWQYVVRLTLCLGAAEMIRWLWPHDRSYWISLTIAIVVHRDWQSALTRTFQRALGTFLGVVLISILFLGLPPMWIMVGLIALLAGARAILIDMNYTAYVAAVTPLIILLLDFGQPPSADLMARRLMATLIGCLIALILGYAVWTRLTGWPQKAAVQKK